MFGEFPGPIVTCRWRLCRQKRQRSWSTNFYVRDYLFPIIDSTTMQLMKVYAAVPATKPRVQVSTELTVSATSINYSGLFTVLHAMRGLIINVRLLLQISVFSISHLLFLRRLISWQPSIRHRLIKNTPYHKKEPHIKLLVRRKQTIGWKSVKLSSFAAFYWYCWLVVLKYAHYADC